MSYIVPVKLKECSYNIIVGNNIFPSLGRHLENLSLGQCAFVVTNPLIKRLWGDKLTKTFQSLKIAVEFFTVLDSETSKSFPVAAKLIESIAHQAQGRDIFIVALGGGVIGDLAGFVAAIYKRGVPYIQIPTTLLAQIDSAIGGKTGVDLSVGKNLAGAFYQPEIVLSDVAFLKTLDKRQIQSGLSEAIKYGVIFDKSLFEFIETNDRQLLECQMPAVLHLVHRCSRIKATVVSQDEKETKGIRTLLNFGHTVGHAIEAAGNFRIHSHGEAVALGMRVAGRISQDLGLWNQNDLKRLETLINRAGLPKKIKKIKLNQILKCMQHDKKFKSGKNKFVLPTQIGRVKIVEGISMEIIIKAIEAYYSYEVPRHHVY